MPIAARYHSSVGRSFDQILGDLLDERKDDIATDVLATEFLALPVRPTAARIFDLLSDQAATVVRARLPSLLATLACRDERWDRVVRSALRRRGRCPPGLRASLRLALSARDRPAAAFVMSSGAYEQGEPPAVDRLLVHKRWATGHIRMTTAASSIDGVPALLRALTEAGSPKKVQLDFSECDHVYIVGLAVLAAWARARHAAIEVVGASPATDAYLQDSGFVDAVEGRPHVVGARDAGRLVALEHIAPGVAAEQLASRIVRILDDHGLVAGSNRNALVICFAELIENVVRHAGGGSVGFVGAQYYPGKQKLTIVVADTGVGVRRSFVDGRNPEIRRRIDRGEDPLRLAVSPLVTSKPVTPLHDTGHAGYGLYLASEITVRNGGTFRITSDDRSLTLYRQRNRPRAAATRHSRWQGTIVALVLDLQNVISIRDVYASLPYPEGYAAGDFFA